MSKEWLKRNSWRHLFDENDNITEITFDELDDTLIDPAIKYMLFLKEGKLAEALQILVEYPKLKNVALTKRDVDKLEYRIKEFEMRQLVEKILGEHHVEEVTNIIKSTVQQVSGLDKVLTNLKKVSDINKPVVCLIDGKKYTEKELLDVIEKSARYDEVVKIANK